MKQGGIGVGSASIVLVFAVLCLSVFSLITFVVAGNDKALVDTEAGLVTGYYEADAQAERIVADILEADGIPEVVRGIEINSYWDFEADADITYFLYPISDQRSLFVSLAIRADSYDILSWRMYDTGDWTFDDSLNVWQGPSDMDFGDPGDVWAGLDFGDGDPGDAWLGLDFGDG